MKTVSTVKKIIIVAATLTCMAIVIASIVGVAGNKDRKLQDMLDLGAKYLEEMEYESAVAAYKEALEIDPYSVEAYLGIIEAYRQLGDLDSALEYAMKGYEMTGNDKLKVLIEQLQNELKPAVAQSPSPTPNPTTQPEVQPTPEPETPEPDSESSLAATDVPVASPSLVRTPEPAFPSQEVPAPSASESEEMEEDGTGEEEPSETVIPEETPRPVVQGSVSGTVYELFDRSTPVSGAVVSIYKQGSSEVSQLITVGSDGNYMVQLPVGEYLFDITAEGRGTVTFPSVIVAQDQTTIMDPAYLDGYNVVSGNIYDALTGQGIEDVGLTFRNGWDNLDAGEIVASANTRTNGKYDVILPYGNYTIYAVKPGYVDISVNVTVDEQVSVLQNGTMLPSVADDNFRIVLTWGENPCDLDSHVRGIRSDGRTFHVYYENKSCYDGEVEICNLDVDDVNSYGPETVTLQPTTALPHYYYIHRFAGIGTLAESGARINVYRGEELLNTFEVPTDQGNGDYWNVFALVDGNVIVQNTITDFEDVTYAETSDSTESSGSDSTEGSSAESTESSGTEFTEGSGAESTESSGTESTEGSGAESTESSSTESTEGSGAEPTESSGMESI